MADFDNLGQIPPEEFAKMMDIEDISQREAAIKNWRPKPLKEDTKVVDGRLHIADSNGEYQRVPLSMNEARQKSNVNPQIRAIADSLSIDMGKFEPTDNQGYSMDGVVSYDGVEYPVSLSAYEGSYSLQAARQIYESQQENKSRVSSVDADLGISTNQPTDVERGHLNDGLDEIF